MTECRCPRKRFRLGQRFLRNGHRRPCKRERGTAPKLGEEVICRPRWRRKQRPKVADTGTDGCDAMTAKLLVRRRQQAHKRAEVGIVLLTEHQRQGYAAAALRQLHAYAANHLHLRSLYAYVGENNLPAQHLFRTVGYQPSASLPRWIEGEHTATLFQILL